MGLAQQKKFLKAFEGYSAVLLYDADRREDQALQPLIANLQRNLGSKQFAVVWLPDGQDPGGLSREFLREYVQAEAAKKGVALTWTAR